MKRVHDLHIALVFAQVYGEQFFMTNFHLLYLTVSTHRSVRGEYYTVEFEILLGIRKRFLSSLKLRMVRLIL